MILKKWEKEDDVRIFEQADEDRIREIIKSVNWGFKKTVQIHDKDTKVSYIIWVDWKEYINDGSEQFKEELFNIQEELVRIYTANDKTDSLSMEALQWSWYNDTIVNQFNFLTTANTDWASHIHKAQLEFISQWQSHVEPDNHWNWTNPAKMHESDLWAMLNKTEWFPREIRRVLKNGGRAIIADKIAFKDHYSEDVVPLFITNHSKTGIYKDEINEILSRNNLKIISASCGSYLSFVSLEDQSSSIKSLF